MKRRLEFAVTREMAGRSVRQFLQEELSFSGHQISRLKFQEEGIRVDGEKVYVNHVLKEGEILTVGLTEQVLRRDTEGGKPGKIWEAPAPELSKYPLQVLYEDSDLLIVNKPAGMVCHPSPGHYSDTLANQAAAHLGGTGTAMDMRVTGRLDRETSGIVTFARNSEAAAMIQRQREDGRLIKIYLALAEGRFELPEGVVDFPLRREAPGSHFMICAPDGKAARTFYRVLAETKGAEGEPRTLLACCIEHGRTLWEILCTETVFLRKRWGFMPGSCPCRSLSGRTGSGSPRNGPAGRPFMKTGWKQVFSGSHLCKID